MLCGRSLVHWRRWGSPPFRKCASSVFLLVLSCDGDKGDRVLLQVLYCVTSVIRYVSDYEGVALTIIDNIISRRKICSELQITGWNWIFGSEPITPAHKFVGLWHSYTCKRLILSVYGIFCLKHKRKSFWNKIFFFFFLWDGGYFLLSVFFYFHLLIWWFSLNFHKKLLLTWKSIVLLWEDKQLF